MEKYSFQKPKTLLQYPLDAKQHVFTYHIIPTVISCFVYILHFTADLVLTFQHYHVGESIHASLTLLWMFVPVIGSFFLTVTNLELWPEEDGFGMKSFKWLSIRFFQHLLFPVWAMFRYAEQLFWQIEAFRTDCEEEREDLLNRSRRRSVFNLYYFLQAYFQAAPQVLLQIRLIMNHPSDFDKSTVDLQIMSIVLSIIRMAMTTTTYQRFQSQKLTGREYPWDKLKEKLRKTRFLIPKLDTSENNKEESSKPNLSRKNSGLSTTSSQYENMNLKMMKKFEVPLRIDSIHGLSDDDMAGKCVANLWWFCFILPRTLTISIFAYYYPLSAFFVCFAHYIIILILLLKYANLRTEPSPSSENEDDEDKLRRCEHITSELVQKIAFYLITSYVYIFCLIEVKIRFTRVTVVYNWYFIIVYLQNIVMMSLWYFQIEKVNEWWYDYLFYLIVVSSILSVLSMAMYLRILKPQKVMVNKTYRHSRL